MKKFGELTKEELWSLRKEITLNSLYIADYRNSFGFDAHCVCDFFDSWLSYMENEMIEDGHADAGDKFFDCLKDYDNADFLWSWYMCYDDFSWAWFDIDFVKEKVKDALMELEDIADADEVLCQFGKVEFVDVKIDDGLDDDGEDKYLMMRAYEVCFNEDDSIYVRLYYGDNSRKITSYEFD